MKKGKILLCCVMSRKTLLCDLTDVCCFLLSGDSLKNAPFDHLCSTVEELRVLLPAVTTVP